MRRLLALLLAALVLAALPTAAEARKVRSKESWRKYTGGERDYWLYVPPGKAPPRGRPLVVYLHGCSQNDDEQAELAFGSRWNELARREGFMVMYPIQRDYDMEHPETVDGNGGGCWNWFLDENMHRGAGEPKVIADLTQGLIKKEHIDRRHVYAMGVSAGADMVATLAATYPDVFKAVAMFAGCAYNLCSDVTGTAAWGELSRAGLKPPSAIVFQGDGDALNNYAMGETLRRQQVATHDHADDGQANGSVALASTEEHGDPSAMNPGSGNPCVGEHSNWPCLSGVTGWASYPYTVEHYRNAGGVPVVDWWVIHGLGHNYPNGDTRATFTDPAGPDITTAAWRFFTDSA